LSSVAEALRAADLGALQFAMEELLDDRLRIEAPRVELLREIELRKRWLEPAVALVFESTDSTERALVDLDESLANALIVATLETSARPVTSAPLRAIERGVLAYAVASVLSRLPSFSWNLRSILVTHEAAFSALGDGPFVAATFAFVGPHLRANARLLLPASLARAHRPEPRVRATTREVPVDCAILAGHGSLAASAIAALQLGDTVTLDVASWLPNGAGVLGLTPTNAAFPVALVRPSSAGYEVVRTNRSLDEPTAKGHIRMPTTEPPADLLDVPVEFTAELGRVRLTVGELSRLAEGTILETGLALPATVVLRAGEKAFAEGVLVDVDGEVGVRITKLR
jgi:type III secretion system YscQ/HrcQ family protein